MTVYYFYPPKKARDLIFEKINSFLKIRGLKLNRDKTEFINLLNTTHPFKFVGFSFRTLIKNGRQVIYSYSHKNAMEKLFESLKKKYFYSPQSF